MLSKQWDRSSVNPSAHEFYYLVPESPQSPKDSKKMSLGYHSSEDERRMGQELFVSRKDHIVHNIKAPFTNNMQTHKAWHSREP